MLLKLALQSTANDNRFDQLSKRPQPKRRARVACSTTLDNKLQKYITDSYDSEGTLGACGLKSQGFDTSFLVAYPTSLYLSWLLLKATEPQNQCEAIVYRMRLHVWDLTQLCYRCMQKAIFVYICTNIVSFVLSRKCTSKSHSDSVNNEPNRTIKSIDNGLVLSCQSHSSHSLSIINQQRQTTRLTKKETKSSNLTSRAWSYTMSVRFSIMYEPPQGSATWGIPVSSCQL